MIKLSHELSKDKYSVDAIITHKHPSNDVQVTVDESKKTYTGKKSKKRTKKGQRVHGYGDISAAYNAKRTKQADERKDGLLKAIKSGDITNVQEAKEFLNVSVSTVHRYLKDLNVKLKSH